MSKFAYGMKDRPCDKGCQPRGFTDVYQDDSGKYFNVLFYQRKLEGKELFDYGLVYLGEV